MGKQIPWNGGYFNVSTLDKVAETIKVAVKLKNSVKKGAIYYLSSI